MKQEKSVRLAVIIVLVIAAIGAINFPHHAWSDANRQTVVVKKKPKSKAKKKVVQKDPRPYPDPANLAKPGSWQVHSQPVKPDLATVPKLWIRVSILGNRTYIMSGNKPVYTMLSSAGRIEHGKSLTPTGTFKIQDERGQKFFNQKLNEGAHFYVSWRNHGIYLFHSVPTKKDDHFNVPQAKKLGKQPASSGCIRLSIPDAQWLMEKVPTGTRVVIKND